MLGLAHLLLVATHLAPQPVFFFLVGFLVLCSIIDDVRGLPLPLVRKYATEVLLGLRYMHGIGLLHRDVKGVLSTTATGFLPKLY